MESVTYLTAMLLDHYENQDCDVEAAIVKVCFFLYFTDELIGPFILRVV